MHVHRKENGSCGLMKADSVEVHSSRAAFYWKTKADVGKVRYRDKRMKASETRGGYREMESGLGASFLLEQDRSEEEKQRWVEEVGNGNVMRSHKRRRDRS